MEIKLKNGKVRVETEKIYEYFSMYSERVKLIFWVLEENLFFRLSKKTENLFLVEILFSQFFLAIEIINF